MADEKKPTFTDCTGKEVFAHIDMDGDNPKLRLSVKAEDGSQTDLLELNKYDAKQLAAACELYLRQQFSITFATVDAMLTAEDRMKLYQNELDAIDDHLADK